MALVMRQLKPPHPSYRTQCDFTEGSIFREAKRQIVREIEEAMALLGITRLILAQKMKVIPSAVTQSLDLERGIQLTTLVRMADILDCELEVNFIRKSKLQIVQAEEVEIGVQ